MRTRRQLQPGAFVVPSTAQLRSIADEHSLLEVWRDVGESLAYPKPNGWRIQIHKTGDAMKLFARSGTDWSYTFRGVVQTLRDPQLPDSLILDTELVGFDAVGQHVEPARMQGAAEFRCYVLDLLYIGGTDLTEAPTVERLSRLTDCLARVFSERLALAKYEWIRSAAELRSLYANCLARRAAGFDGVIVKRPRAAYFTPALKLKPEDTIDAVVVGAYRGADGAIGSVLLAVPDRRGRWIPVAKVARPNVDWDSVWPACAAAIVPQRPRNLEDPPERPDLWLEPRVVVTAAMRWASKSSSYASGIKLEAVRSCTLRPDKGPNDATPIEAVMQIVNRPPESEQPSLFLDNDPK